MRSFDLTQLAIYLQSLTIMAGDAQRQKGNLNGMEIIQTKIGIRNVIAFCATTELVSAKAAAERLLGEVETGVLSFKSLGSMLDDVRLRMFDELKAREVVELTPREAEHYSQPRKGWELVIEKLPSITSEIEEARKCFALSRHTACVFHLMRVLEPALKSVADALGIKKHSPAWNAYLAAMPKAIEGQFPDKTKAHAEKREYYSSLEAQLRAIKTAWRNPTMHDVAKVYTEEMAEELMTHVRSFMREAAREHSEPITEF